jgi:formylglycine-generating enzyme required for sulfatase activity
MSALTWFRVLGLCSVLSVVVLIVPGWTQPATGKKAAEKWGKEITNSIGMKLVRIPPGKFTMGSPTDEDGHGEDEKQHEVEITQEFWLGVHEVTQKEYEKIVGKNPSFYSKNGGGKAKVAGKNTEDFPVEDIVWDEATEFCKKLTDEDKNKPTGWVYRLPTEAEWEYSCRGGAPAYQTFSFGNSLSSRQANFDGNLPYGGADKGPYLEVPCKVGSYKANPYGLFDMHGNVGEWCWDWYDKDYYARSPAKDPPGPATGRYRVIRGGNCYLGGRACRSAERRTGGESFQSGLVGFRVALARPIR